jgi:ABC-2 type transport system ATP-binding protein
MMIALDAVTKRYGPKTIVHGLTFSVGRNEIVGFLGPNGAGKTTTLRMVAGYTTCSEGKVTVAGFDMATQNLEAARRIGYLPEHPPLYDTLDVTGYLRFVARVKAIPKPAIGSELDRVIDACHLEEVAKREIFKLSKGYRQRVGLAQALLGDPDVLLLDEPTIGLDPGQIHESREVIRAFGHGHTVLLSTHILAEVSLICQRVAIIRQGRLLAMDTPQGLQRAVESTHRVALEIVAPEEELRDTLMGVDGVRAVEIRSDQSAAGALSASCDVDEREGIEARIARAVAGRWDLLRLARPEPSLENVFLSYVRGNHSAGPA